jgi:hypothetical protein
MDYSSVMNGISSLRSSLVFGLTDIFILRSVLLWFSLDLFDTSRPCLPPWISWTRLTSLRHLGVRWKSAPLAAGSVLGAQRSELSVQYVLVSLQPSTVQSHDR